MWGWFEEVENGEEVDCKEFYINILDDLEVFVVLFCESEVDEECKDFCEGIYNVDFGLCEWLLVFG